MGKISVDEVRALNESGNRKALIELASNPDLPIEAIEAFSGSTLVQLREAVASNRSIDPSTAERLSKDEDEAVLISLIKNRSTPISVIENMVKPKNSPSIALLKTVASRPILNKTLFRRLINEGSEIRIALSANRAIPKSELHRLDEVARKGQGDWLQKTLDSLLPDLPESIESEAF